MSHEGKMRRGLRWYGNRNLEGELPTDITNDSNKMNDVNYYLANKPKPEEKKETKSKGKK